MSGIRIDVDAFFRRAAKLYSTWKDPSSSPNASDWSSMDAFLCGVGVDEDMVFSKSTSLQTWLVGYELTDTMMLFTEGAVTVLASKKKIDFLRTLEANSGSGKYAGSKVPTVKLLVRDKSDSDKKNFERIIEAVKESKKGKSLGVLTKDLKFKGGFMDAWRSYWGKHGDGLEHTDMMGAITYLMAPKEESEVGYIKRAAGVSSDVFSKFYKEQIMDIIDNDKKVKHSKLAEGIEKALSDKKYVPNLDTSQVEICYPAIIQSGGNYKLKFSAISDKEYVHFGAIICSFGARYKSYCSNIVRTMLVNPSEKIQKTYDFLLSLEEHLLSKLKKGARLGDVYSSTINKVKKEQPDLVDKLTKNLGFSMGIEFKDASIAIAANNDVIVRKGMVFNVNLGISGLTNKDATDSKGKNVSLFIGDTVVVGDGDAPATLLTTTKKKMKNISVFLKDSDSSDDEKENKNDLADIESFGRGKRSAVLDNKLRTDNTAEERRKNHQRELMQKMNDEALERLKQGGDVKAVAKVRKAPVSYRSPGQLPREKEVQQLKIYVDKKYETIIMPIFGVPVPFHIATVKNISISFEGDYTYLRINFFHPGAAINKDQGGTFSNPDATYLKELTYRSSNLKEPGELSAPSSNLNTACRLIKELQKKYKTREVEEKEKADLVQQDTLVISAGKGNPKLKDLYIKPNLVQKRLSGILEAHSNGLRYTSIRGDKVDILYNNIKHAFFQPCDGEMIILLHFHLKNAVLFGKKKQSDVQFYTEVGEITTDLGKHQHMHDRDDLAAEQAERELRHKLKQAFKGFTEKVESVTRGELEFEVPFRELGFHGVPFRETVLLQPTSACLVSLTNWPPFTVTLEDIQLVHFERVQFSLKNFDMVFIFKNYSKKVVMVTTIPMNMLDHVKDWLNSVDIKYTEGLQSLNWTKIMKTIVEDPEEFFETGGWNFLGPESDEEAGDEETDSEDGEFQVSGSGDDAVEESEDDYSSEVVSEDDDYGDMDSDESSGKDWSDLEREAAEDDEIDSDGGGDRGRSKKMKHKSSSHRERSSPSKHSSSSKHGGSSSSSSRHPDKHSRHSSDKHSSSRHSDKRKRDRDSSGSSRHHKSPKKHRR